MLEHYFRKPNLTEISQSNRVENTKETQKIFYEKLTKTPFPLKPSASNLHNKGSVYIFPTQVHFKGYFSKQTTYPRENSEKYEKLALIFSVKRGKNKKKIR